MSKKINTYEPTDVNYHGGMEHGANIHAVSVQVNQYVWDMIKILNSNNLYGFDFQAKIGTKKTIVVMKHKDKELLDEARKLLKDSHFYSEFNFVFLAKVEKEKNDKTVWIVLGLLISFSLIGWLLFSLYEKNLIFSSFNENRVSIKKINSDKLVVEEVEIDIEKLKALKDVFSDQNNSIPDPVMQMMEVTTSVISSLVSEEEKAKYSSKNLVEKFNGKSGIKFVLKDGNLSKDFNASVKELNGYAESFIKDSNISLALKCYDKALSKDKNITNKDDLLVTLMNQSKLYEDINQPISAKESYREILKLSSGLAKEDLLKYGFSEAWSLTKVAKVNKDLNQTFPIDSALTKAEGLYKTLLKEFRKQASNGEPINEASLAWALNFLANFYANDKKEVDVSIELRKEAEAFYKKLAEREPKKYQLLYYKTLNSLGKSYLKTHKIALANKSYQKGMALTKRLPLKYEALSFSALGKVEIASEDFDRANRYYNNALEIYRKNSKKYRAEIVNMGSLFAGLEAKKGNLDLAKQRYKDVILSYKEMNRETPLVYNLQIAKELNRLASLNFSVSKNFLEAEIKVFEAISFCKKSKEIESKEANLLEAESYRYLAYLATLEKNMQTAWDYYKKANALKYDKI